VCEAGAEGGEWAGLDGVAERCGRHCMSVA
jgi:hypothetical protein